MSTPASRAAERDEEQIRERYSQAMDLHWGPAITGWAPSVLRVRVCLRDGLVVANVEVHDGWHRAVGAEVVSQQQWPPRPDTPERVQWFDQRAQAMGVSPKTSASEDASGLTPSGDGRFKVGDVVRYRDFRPMLVSAVHDSHGLSYETTWTTTGGFAGNYAHEDLRAVDDPRPGEVGSAL